MAHTAARLNSDQMLDIKFPTLQLPQLLINLNGFSGRKTPRFLSQAVPVYAYTVLPEPQEDCKDFDLNYRSMGFG